MILTYILGVILAHTPGTAQAQTRAHGLQAGARIPGRNVVELSWEVPISPGGPVVTLNGTVQEVYAQLLKINPNYGSQLGPTTDSSSAYEGNSELNSPEYEIKTIVCGAYYPALVARIEEGIKHLRSVPGSPGNGPGPKDCGRVSCSWNAAIYWCNDAPPPKSITSFGNIADGAQKVLEHCIPDFSRVNKWEAEVSGYVSYADDWSVVITGDHC